MNNILEIKSLGLWFSLNGMPGYTYFDREVSFISIESRDYISQKWAATSKTTPYHPTGNVQIERFGLPLDHNLQIPHYTNVFFAFPRCLSHSRPLSSWLMSLGPVLLKKFIRNNKTNPYVDQVKHLI